MLLRYEKCVPFGVVVFCGESLACITEKFSGENTILGTNLHIPPKIIHHDIYYLIHICCENFEPKPIITDLQNDVLWEEYW